MKKSTKKLNAAKIKLKQIVAAARAAGAEVTVTFDPNEKRMPTRFPNDHPLVLALVDESERCNALGMRWVKAKIQNPMAAEICFRNGWGYALAAAWLRVQLSSDTEIKKGEWIEKFLKKSDSLNPWQTTVEFKGPGKAKGKK